MVTKHFQTRFRMFTLIVVFTLSFTKVRSSFFKRETANKLAKDVVAEVDATEIECNLRCNINQQCTESVWSNKEGTGKCMLLGIMSKNTEKKLLHPPLQLFENIRDPTDAGWLVQNSNVCYGTKNDLFGKVHLNRNGFLVALKLTHITGYLTCDKNVTHYKTNWGCKHNGDHLLTIITDNEQNIIFPTVEVNAYGVYDMPGYDSNSNKLEFWNDKDPMAAYSGQVIEIWYGEDLNSYTETDNAGIHCVRVHAMFRQRL